MTWPEPIRKALAELDLAPEPAAEDAAWIAAIVVPGAAAFDAWRRLADACRGHGWWPVILGSPEDAAQWPPQSPADRAAAVADAIAAADDVDLASFMLRGEAQDDDFDGSEVDEGDWPDDVSPPTVPSAVADHKGRPRKAVTIALFRVDQPWAALAQLGYGGWNDCPETAAQVARHRDWQARFGAEVCVATPDTIECVLARPPATRDAASALAREQYFYCYDIVEQGTGSLAVLAAGLLDAPIWFFWWD